MWAYARWGSRIHHFQFTDQQEMARTFVRFQEHYESPKYKEKIFTLTEFTDWYAKTQGTDYFSDWEGFNFPGANLNPFMDGRFNPLTEQEHGVCQACAPHRSGGPFYVIASLKGDEQTFLHEIAHALYYLNSEYRTKVMSILGASGGSVVEHLAAKGYGSGVLQDELHAYLLCDRQYLMSEGVDLNPYSAQIEKLQDNFRRYSSDLKLLNAIG